MNLWGSLVQPPIQSEESPSKVDLIACSLAQVSLDISRDIDPKANLDPCTRAQMFSVKNLFVVTSINFLC